jgi:hypothetical protein
MVFTQNNFFIFFALFLLIGGFGRMWVVGIMWVVGMMVEGSG